MNSHEHRIKRRHRKPGALVVQLLEATGHVRHSQEVELRHENGKDHAAGHRICESFYKVEGTRTN